MEPLRRNHEWSYTGRCHALAGKTFHRNTSLEGPQALLVVKETRKNRGQSARKSTQCESRRDRVVFCPSGRHSVHNKREIDLAANKKSVPTHLADTSGRVGQGKLVRSNGGNTNRACRFRKLHAKVGGWPGEDRLRADFTLPQRSHRPKSKLTPKQLRCQEEGSR